MLGSLLSTRWVLVGYALGTRWDISSCGRGYPRRVLRVSGRKSERIDTIACVSSLNRYSIYFMFFLVSGRNRE